MIDSSLLLSQLQSTKTSRTTMVKRLEDDLRKRCDEEPTVDAPLKVQYEAAKAGGAHRPDLQGLAGG